MADKTESGWQVLNDRVVDDFKIFRTRKSLRRNLRNGHEIDFFLMDGLNWANVIALTPANEVVLIRQYRHGVDREVIEIPGGCIEKGEDPAAGAARELEEETGYRAESLVTLGEVAPNPALMSLTCFFYVARDVVPDGKMGFDPGENIEVLLRPLDQVFEMVAGGEMQHALHVAAFGLLALQREKFAK